jgi:hypothetical protein
MCCVLHVVYVSCVFLLYVVYMLYVLYVYCVCVFYLFCVCLVCMCCVSRVCVFCMLCMCSVLCVCERERAREQFYLQKLDMLSKLWFILEYPRIEKSHIGSGTEILCYF